MEITFESVSNITFFAAGCSINYRLYLVQNSSASPQQLSSIKIQLRSENLHLGDHYSVNISDSLSSPTIQRLNAGTVKFDITTPLPQDGYLEIKFNASVPATLGPLALLQVVFNMTATASSSVTYGPKQSKELYTNYPEITFARTTQGGKIYSNIAIQKYSRDEKGTLIIFTIVESIRYMQKLGRKRVVVVDLQTKPQK